MPRSRACAATLALHETPASAAQSGLRLERAGGDAADDDAVAARLEGSALATEALGLQWHTWSRRSWWDPGWQDSLALGHNAPAIAGFGVQRAAVMPSASPWLAWFGPWNLEFFVGALAGVETPRRPFLVGSRLSLRPFDGLEIGLTRTAQWGGRGWRQLPRLSARTRPAACPRVGSAATGSRPGRPTATGADSANCSRAAAACRSARTPTRPAPTATTPTLADTCKTGAGSAPRSGPTRAS